MAGQPARGVTGVIVQPDVVLIRKLKRPRGSGLREK